MNGRLRVGDFLVDRDLGRLAAAGVERRVEPKVMDLLLALARRPGDVLSRDELLASIWGDVCVSGSALSRAVFLLRAALGDDARSPRYIETIPKRGYRLVAAVSPEPARVAEAGPSALAVLPFDVEFARTIARAIADELTRGERGPLPPRPSAARAPVKRGRSRRADRSLDALLAALRRFADAVRASPGRGGRLPRPT